jgi:galactose-1-phosphate uridylyltransferase
MADYSPFFIRMKDDTIKQVNPFTGTEVWTVPGRASKPITNAIPANAKKIEKKDKEDYCNFCEVNYLNTPPEKERLVKVAKKCIPIPDVKPQQLHLTKPLLRRIPNLFEIVTMEYWRQNYGYSLPEEVKKNKQAYLDNKKGFEHVMNVINMKLKLLGKDPASISDKQKEDMADAFFGGGHELIVGPRHYVKDAEFETQLFSAGDFTHQEHHEYIKFTIRGMMSIYKNNRYVRYVSIFQNWLKPAGASFDHLHKQLVAIDERGVSIEREIKLLRQNPNFYN